MPPIPHVATLKRSTKVELDQKNKADLASGKQRTLSFNPASKSLTLATAPVPTAVTTAVTVVNEVPVQ